MSRFLFLASLPLCFLFGSYAHAEAPSADAPLRQLEQRVRATLPELEDELNFEYPESSASLVVSYRTRAFQVHGQLPKTGEYEEKAHTEFGPGAHGFQLKLHLQKAGTVNQAQLPTTLRAPYWETELDLRPLAGTDQQVYWALSPGSRLDANVRKRLRSALRALGQTEPARPRP